MTLDQIIAQKQNKWLWRSAAIGLTAMVLLNVLLMIRLWPIYNRYETALGDFQQPVILNRVSGFQGPTAKQGDITVLQQDRCVNRETKVVILTGWTSAEGAINVPNREEIKHSALKGCTTITMALAMPERITPGKWYITGIVRDETSAEPRYWTSEIFVVVP